MVGAFPQRQTEESYSLRYIIIRSTLVGLWRNIIRMVVVVVDLLSPPHPRLLTLEEGITHPHQ